jgi:hypothetical protein
MDTGSQGSVSVDKARARLSGHGEFREFNQFPMRSLRFCGSSTSAPHPLAQSDEIPSQPGERLTGLDGSFEAVCQASEAGRPRAGAFDARAPVAEVEIHALDGFYRLQGVGVHTPQQA